MEMCVHLEESLWGFQLHGATWFIAYGRLKLIVKYRLCLPGRFYDLHSWQGLEAPVSLPLCA